MATLGEFEDTVKRVDGACHRVLEEVGSAEAQRHLVGLLDVSLLPFKAGTSFGIPMNGYVEQAEIAATAVRNQANRPSDEFQGSVSDLRQRLFLIASEIVKLSKN